MYVQYILCIWVAICPYTALALALICCANLVQIKVGFIVYFINDWNAMFYVCSRLPGLAINVFFCVLNGISPDTVFPHFGVFFVCLFVSLFELFISVIIVMAI